MSGYNFKLYRWGEPYWTDTHLGFRRGDGGAHLTQDRFDHTFTVPDGMWVLEWFGPISTQNKLWKHGVLGRPKPELLDLGRERLDCYHDSLLLSPEPFLVIKVIYGDDGDGGPFVVPHGAYLLRARQVHKGELGQYVPIELPLVAREERVKGDNHSRKRGDGWVRLTAAAEQAKMTVGEFVLDHWLFVEACDRSGYAAQYRDVRIDMIKATCREQIHKQVIDTSLKISPTRAEFEEMVADNSTDWSQYWIRRGFARTVLLLQRYGWNRSKQNLLLSTKHSVVTS